MVRHSPSLSGIFAVATAAILWGTTGTAATFAPAVNALAIGSVAMGGGGLLQALLATGAIFRYRQTLGAHKWLLGLGAMAVAIYPLSFYASMRYAGVAVGTVVSIGSAPLFAALLEALKDHVQLDRRWCGGAGLGMLGMALLTFAQQPSHDAMTDSTSMFGIGLGLCAGLTYAFYSWTAHRLIHVGIPARAAMGGTFGLGGLLLVPVLLATGGPLLDSWQNGAVGLYMAIVPMCLGYICFGYGLAHVTASVATIITLLEPVVATLLAVVVVKEQLSVSGWVGIALILCCLFIITWPKNRR